MDHASYDPTVDPARTCTRGHPAPPDSRYCPDCGEPVHDEAALVWTTPSDVIPVITHPHHLKRTMLTAVIVGTILFCINQLDVVLAGNATTAVWAKASLTYVVPFVVSNVGILIATHRPAR